MFVDATFFAVFFDVTTIFMITRNKVSDSLKMSKFNCFIVVFFALLALLMERQAKADKLPYKNLERELSVRTSSDDPESNIKEIEKMTETMSPRESSLQSDDFRLLATFLQLKSDKGCSRFTRDIFLTNSVKDLTHEASSPSKVNHSSGRIEKLLNYFCKKHAQDCQDKYLSVLNSKLQTMDKIKLGFVIFYTDTVLNEHYENEQPGKTLDDTDNYELYEEIIEPKELVINEIKDGRIAFDVIRTFEKIYGDNKDLNPTLSPTLEHKISRDAYNIYDQYLVEPCEHYVDELGSSVFEPAKLDAKFYQNIADRPREFYVAWARFSLCSVVVEDNSMSLKVKNIADNSIISGRN